MAVFADRDALITGVGGVLDAADRSGSVWTTRAEKAVGQFETDFSSQARIRQMVCRARATVSGEFTDLGADYGGIKALHIVGSPDQPLKAVSPAEIVRLNSLNTSAGKPTHYSIVGSSLQLHPIPDESYTVEMIVSEDVSPLSSGSSSNWLLARFPHLYLVGALVKLASRYIGDDPRLPEWRADYERALRDMKAADALEQAGHQPTQKIRKLG